MKHSRSALVIITYDLQAIGLALIYFEIAVPSNSVGIENVKDLIQDLEQALDKI